MNISATAVFAGQVYSLATPTPTPAPNLGVPVGVELYNFALAILLFVGAIVVIAIALRFAFRYHEKVLTVIQEAVTSNGQILGSSLGDVGVQQNSGELEIVGPSNGTISRKLDYSLKNPEPGATVSWVAEGGDPASGEGESFATRFDKAGAYSIVAMVTNAGDQPQTVDKVATIGAPARAEGPPAIVIPFVIKNWGRMVVIIFGVGVVSALMSTRVLDAAAGVGILGTLLGVGAATATSGTSSDKPTTTTDDS